MLFHKHALRIDTMALKLHLHSVTIYNSVSIYYILHYFLCGICLKTSDILFRKLFRMHREYKKQSFLWDWKLGA
jgi:hypothetical protein